MLLLYYIICILYYTILYRIIIRGPGEGVALGRRSSSPGLQVAGPSSAVSFVFVELHARLISKTIGLLRFRRASRPNAETWKIFKG